MPLTCKVYFISGVGGLEYLLSSKRVSDSLVIKLCHFAKDKSPAKNREALVRVYFKW